MLINKVIISLLSWSNFNKRLFIFMMDVQFLILSIWIALSLDEKGLFMPDKASLILVLTCLVISLPIFVYFDLYRAVIRYVGFREVLAITKAVTLSLPIIYFFNLLMKIEILSFSFFFIIWILLLLFIISSRLFASWLLTEKSLSTDVVIYGAGSAGIQLASALRYSRELRPVAYVDEDKSVQGNFLNGIKVFSPSKLPLLIREKGIQEILLAIPSAKKYELNRIISSIGELPVKVRVLPGVSELAQGKILVSDLKTLDITDLLGRDPTIPNEDLLEKNIKSKCVMVTGAGGSIGSELCRQISKISPKKLVLYEISEPSLYAIEQELTDLSLDLEIIPILGNILDRERFKEVCMNFSIDTIYHAAAYKQVPMVEKNTVLSFENNVFGTLNCALSARESGVKTFVHISTDKAVRPTNVMGATKRFSELILQALSKDQKEKDKNTKFTIVRFGNVLGSSSSVVPLFRDQIKKGGPVTVTDPEIMRYFMSIPEAAELVIQAGSMGKGSEVFVLDMGEPIKIVDLAKKMIRLSGLEVFDDETNEGDIKVKFTQLRDGEKLYEELMIGDKVSETEHPRILMVDEEFLEWKKIKLLLGEFKEAIKDRDENKVHEILVNSISGFEPYSGLKDLIYLIKKQRKRAD